MNINTIESKKVFIFDVDGTLYSQPKMRLAMALKLFTYYLTHFWNLRHLLSIYYFRKLREDESFCQSAIAEQICAAAKKAKVEPKTAEIEITRWMFEIPLKLVEKYSFKDLIAHIADWQSEGKKIIIYSDYPADEKLKQLNICAAAVFTPEDAGIGELKPSKKAMAYILTQIGCAPENIVYIGDRYEKDGICAQFAGIDYCDIRDFLKILRKKCE